MIVVLEDLLENTENDFIDGIKEIMEVYSLGELKNNKNKELFLRRFNISVFDYLKENYDISYVLFNHNESSFIEKMEKIMIARMLVKKNKSGSEEEAAYIKYETTFITAGNIGIIKKWLNSKNKFSSEQMADMVMRFMKLRCEIDTNIIDKK